MWLKFILAFIIGFLRAQTSGGRWPFEEENHAALLLSGEQYFLDVGMFPVELVDTSCATLVGLNNELERILKRERDNPLSRAAAFNLAIMLEEDAGEVHFQHAMHETEHPSEAIKLFQSLNEADVDHADRIRNYMRQNGIDLNISQPRIEPERRAVNPLV